MSHRFTLIAVCLPVVALVVGIGRAELQRSDRQTYRLPVEGYDPRDLLRGRYLRYRVVEDAAPALDSCQGPDCCLCLASSSAPRIASCDTARDRCEAALPRRHLRELRRYYIPESQARQLERRFIEAAARGRAHVVISVDAVGRPHVHHLELDGTPVR